jgi:hypothetical protein
VNPGDPEQLPQKLKGGQLLDPEQIVERVEEVPAFGVEDEVENLLVVVADDEAGGAEAVVVEVREQHAFAHVLQPVREHHQV